MNMWNKNKLYYKLVSTYVSNLQCKKENHYIII
jgi:hypothetical protein